jgi:hypothetical protein
MVTVCVHGAWKNVLSTGNTGGGLKYTVCM